MRRIILIHLNIGGGKLRQRRGNYGSVGVDFCFCLLQLN